MALAMGLGRKIPRARNAGERSSTILSPPSRARDPGCLYTHRSAGPPPSAANSKLPICLTHYTRGGIARTAGSGRKDFRCLLLETSRFCNGTPSLAALAQAAICSHALKTLAANRRGGITLVTCGLAGAYPYCPRIKLALHLNKQLLIGPLPAALCRFWENLGFGIV
jgi:hypothetical protein